MVVVAMILSKSALQIVVLCKKEAAIPILDNVRIEIDGTVISSARNIILAVSPVSVDTPFKSEGEGVECTLTSDTIKKVVSAIGVDTVFGGKLEFTNITKENDTITFEVRDGKRISHVAGRTYDGPWVRWKEIVDKALNKEVVGRVVLNRARMKLLLDALEKAAPDKDGESPIYMEFTKDDVIFRAFNYKNGQQVLGVVGMYGSPGKWPERTKWETRRIERIPHKG
jgi:hypothetical protein